MKHLIIIILLVSSCANNTYEPQQNDKQTDILGKKIVEIDSCEYIEYYQYGYSAITHKGNCKYCIERNKKNEK